MFRRKSKSSKKSTDCRHDGVGRWLVRRSTPSVNVVSEPEGANDGTHACDCGDHEHERTRLCGHAVDQKAAGHEVAKCHRRYETRCHLHLPKVDVPGDREPRKGACIAASEMGAITLGVPALSASAVAWGLKARAVALRCKGVAR